ncbi:hypothetical protein CR513_39598, partial [Mucuna pruriens]
MTELCKQFKIRHHSSSPYHPKMNGVVEAANENIKRIIKKMVVTYRDWHEMLPFAARYEQLNLIEEKRLTALCHQQRVKKAFNKKVHLREFQKEELILKKILPA